MAEIFPVKVPLDVGAKITLKFTVCPDATVSGRVMPEKVKSLELAASFDIVTLVEPELVKLPVFACFVPTGIFPKLTLAVVASSNPGASALPLTGTVIEGWGASLEIRIVAEALPAAEGLKRTNNVIPLPAAMVTGKLGDTT